MANNIIKRVWNQNKMVNIEALQGMAFQDEDGGHTFEISGIDDDGMTVALSGTVAGVFRRPDNADIAITGSASDGKVSVTLTEDCYAVPGLFALTIFVTADGKKTAVYAAVGTVASTSGGAVAGDTPQDVVDLINAISAAIATIPADYTALMTSIAPTYSSSALYSVGAYAWYNGSLYRCTTDIITAEAWNASHWTAVSMGSDVKELKDDLNDVCVSNGQLIDPYTIGVFTGYITSSGVFKSSSSYRTLYYPCDANTVYSVTQKNGATNRSIALSNAAPVHNASCSYVGSLDANNPVITLNTGEYSYICITFYKNPDDTSVTSAFANIKLQKGAETTEGYDFGGALSLVTYGGLDSVMKNKDKKYSDTVEKVDAVCDAGSGKNLTNISKAISGYYVSLTGIAANANYKYLDYIEVNPSTTYSVFQEGGNVGSLACVFYDENKVALSYHAPFSTAISPATAKYMRVSCSATTTKLAVVEGSVALNVPYWYKLKGDAVTNKTAPKIQKASSGSMGASDSLNIYIPDIKKNGVYGLHMNVSSMGEFTFGPGRAKQNRSAFVTVDATNITIQYYTTSTQAWHTYAHGLTIENELDLTIVQSETEFSYASIRLSSSGASFETPELQYWKGNDSPLTLTINSGEYTDVEMTYYCTDYTKDLYILGDSYLDHWSRYVFNETQNDYRNFLLDGFGGRDSLDAVESLRVMEASNGIPKKLLWCMGMNDGDSGAINANWMKALNIVIDFCNQYNVELILCTIPNVVTVDNTYKNTYIRSSGYRYVDLAKAVGSDDSTSWFSGFLSNDGVHPSTAGDKMIADYMISQVPEMI